MPAAVSLLVIILFSPLDTEAKRLDSDEKKHYRLVSLVIAASLSLIFALSLFLKVSAIYLPLCISLTLEGILLSAGKISQLTRS